MDLRSNSEASSSIQQVYRYSQGWAAQWNAYSADTQKLVSTLTVLIDKNEVMLQILHTLWYSTRSKEWYLQFPISIAPDGRHFSVLRTVYVVGLTAGETTSTAMSLPLQEVPQIFNFWQTPQQELREDNPPWWSVDIGARSTDQDSCNVYFYWIFFDFHAQYICYIDQPLGEQNNIAVFAMTQETHALELSLALVAHTSKRLVAPKRATQRLFDNEREVRQFMVVFHPSLPLLGLAVSRAICLWSFSTGMPSNSVSPHLSFPLFCLFIRSPCCPVEPPKNYTKIGNRPKQTHRSRSSPGRDRKPEFLKLRAKDYRDLCRQLRHHRHPSPVSWTPAGFKTVSTTHK